MRFAVCLAFSFAVAAGASLSASASQASTAANGRSEKIYAQNCANPDRPVLRGSHGAIGELTYNAQFSALLGTNNAEAASQDVKRAACELALWRIDWAVSVLPTPATPQPVRTDSGFDALQGRMAELEARMDRMRERPADATPSGRALKDSENTGAVLLIAFLAFVFSLAAIAFARTSTRKALREAGLL